jgi:hypothetical protein
VDSPVLGRKQENDEVSVDDRVPVGPSLRSTPSPPSLRLKMSDRNGRRTRRTRRTFNYRVDEFPIRPKMNTRKLFEREPVMKA